ncbi:MAG: zf-HC2 domain-containing protein [bacterium]|nr:MAG: zf-HC2 domain-containing protein [bacterium]
MDCHLFHMLIQRYYDGLLDAIERADYENHRRTCPACRLADSEHATVFRALDGIPRLVPSQSFNAKVLAQVDISRYRVGAAKKVSNAIGRGWFWIPFPVRVGIGISAVFALFVTAYGPFIDFFASLGERFTALIGSGMIAVRELAIRSETLIKSLGSATNYRLAGEVLLATFQRWIAGLPLSYIVMATAVMIIVLLFAIRAARTAWSKGETHVSVL